jgi:hypothetical protein
MKAAAVPSLLEALPPSVRKLAVRQLQFLHLLESRPVVLAAPFTITVR